jgi:hypothetical protein
MNNSKFGKAWLYVVYALLFVSGCKIGGDNKKEREFKNLHQIEKIALDLPLMRFQAYRDFVFAYEYSNKSLFKLNPSFQVIDTLGGWGDGPKENLLVRNYHVFSDYKAAIFDTEKSTFKIQDFSDSVYYYHKFTKNVERGVFLNEDLLITLSSGSKMKLEFDFFDIKKSEFIPIKNINKLYDLDYSFLIHEGKLLQNKNTVVFTPYFSDQWFTFNSETGELNVGKYLKEFPIPQVKQIGDGFMLDEAPDLIIDSFILGNYLAIISNVGEKKLGENRILDLYSLSDLSYSHSYVLPDLNDAIPDDGFVLRDSKIGIVYEDELVIFELQFE